LREPDGQRRGAIKVTQGQALWPAFWLLGSDLDTVGRPAAGEVDAMEMWGADDGPMFRPGPGHRGPDAGQPDDTTPLPATLEVRSIKAWTY